MPDARPTWVSIAIALLVVFAVLCLLGGLATLLIEPGN
jgi:hypothetical protein